jgi:hypothetical protein
MIPYDHIEPNEPSIFDEGQEDRLEAKGIELFEARKTMLEAAQRDPEEYPTITRLAARLGLSIEIAQQLQEFVDTDFAEWRMTRIADRSRLSFTEDGKIVDPITKEPLT